MLLNVQLSSSSKEEKIVSSHSKCFLTIRVIWSLMGKVVYDSLLGLWFFLLFINFKVSFLHTRNGFIYHLHLAKWVPRVHHAMLRSKHLASFLFSWGHYHLFTFLFHITHQLLLYQTLMVPFLSKICGPCPRLLTISGPVLLPWAWNFLSERKEREEAPLSLTTSHRFLKFSSAFGLT